MNKIKQIIKNYRKNEANSIFLKNILLAGSILLSLYLFLVINEKIFYLNQINREKLVNFFFAISFIIILFVIIKWIITRKTLFNYKNDFSIAKKIGLQNKIIKDNFLNVLQINKDKSHDNKDLKLYAINQLSKKLKNYIEPKIIFIYPIKEILLFISILFISIILLSKTNFNTASYRLRHFNEEFKVPLPFTLTSLSGSYTALSGDTLDINISGLGELPDSIEINWITNNILNKKPINHNKEIYQTVLPNITDDIIYWAEYKATSFFSAWDQISTPIDTIRIKQRPIIKDISFKITSPSYANLNPYIHNQSNDNQIKILRGSIINIKASTDKKLNMAWILNGDERIDLITNQTNIYGDITFNNNMYFSIFCLDEEYIANLSPIQYSFIIKDDPPPTITIQSPEFAFELDESLIIPLKANIYDEYGINKIWIEYNIVSPDFQTLNNKNGKFNLSLNSQNSKNHYLDYQWDINNINILMGDEIHFWLVAEDSNNITGPGRSQSAELIGKFPSLEDLFSRIEEYEDDTEEITEEIQNTIDEISEITEDVRLEFLKTDELSWEQEKKLEKTFDDFEKTFEQIEEIQKNIDNILEQSDDNNLFDNELMDKFDHFKDMLQSMMSDELMQAMEDLQKALENMDPKKILEALQNYEFNVEKFEEELDRFIDMFEIALAEQKLNELSEQIENMINKQKDLIDEINNNQDNYVLEKKSSKQEKRFSDFENLLDDTQNSLKELSETTSKKIEQLKKNELTNQTKENLIKQTENIQEEKNSELDINSQQANLNLEKIEEKISEISQQFKNETMHKMTKEFVMIIDNLLTMSNQQEKLIFDAKGIRSNNPKIKNINQEQNNIDRELNQVTKQLISLSNQTFFINPQINRTTGKLKNSVSATVSFFEQKKISQARQKQLEVLRNINEITFLLLLSMEEMQNSNSASGFEQFMQSLEEMSKQQQGVNQSTMQLSQMGMMQQQSLLDQLMKQQQELKKQLGELLKNMSGEETGGLPNAHNEMEDVLKDFEKGTINQKTIERQQRILSRMLDSQKSLTKKDFSEKRQNKIAEELNYSSPGELPNNLGGKDLILIDAMESAIEEGLSPEYQKLIRMYFLNLQKEANTNE